MTTLEHRPNTALLVVEVQMCVVEGTPRRDTVVANVGTLVEKARREQVPVVWVQHSDEQIVRGSDGWRIVPELNPDDAEPLVEKHYGDSFEDTSLESVLSGLGVGRLMVVGAQTDACIRSTLHGALARGYDAPRSEHDRGPDSVGRAAGRDGHRAHQPLLDLPDRPRPDGRNRRDQGRRLQNLDGPQELVHVLQHPVGETKEAPRARRRLGRLAGADKHGNGRLFDGDQQCFQVAHQVHDARQRIVVLTQ